MTWERIEAFVQVEVPVRVMLRISDGHTPNLAQMCFGFEQAERESINAVTAVVRKHPLLYYDLRQKVVAAFAKRKKDIVTPMCLATSMVLRLHVLSDTTVDVYNPDGGSQAITAVIERYYKDDVAMQLAAKLNYQDFREKASYFGEANTQVLANNYDAENFWKITALHRAEGSDLFRKLVDGYAGQGESERMNKHVKKFSYGERVRQTHAVTSGMMEADTILRMMSKVGEISKAPYLECLRDKFYETVDANNENARAAAERVMEEQELVGDEEDEVDDAEYGRDVADAGRDALLLLLQAAQEVLEEE